MDANGNTIPSVRQGEKTSNHSGRASFFLGDREDTSPLGRRLKSKTAGISVGHSWRKAHIAAQDVLLPRGTWTDHDIHSNSSLVLAGIKATRKNTLRRSEQKAKEKVELATINLSNTTMASNLVIMCIQYTCKHTHVQQRIDLASQSAKQTRTRMSPDHFNHLYYPHMREIWYSVTRVQISRMMNEQRGWIQGKMVFGARKSKKRAKQKRWGQGNWLQLLTHGSTCSARMTNLTEAWSASHWGQWCNLLNQPESSRCDGPSVVSVRGTWPRETRNRVPKSGPGAEHSCPLSFTGYKMHIWPLSMA